MKKLLLTLFLIFCLAGALSAAEAELTLERAVTLALERNSRLAQSATDLQISKLNYIKAAGIALPKVSLKYDYSHLHYRDEQETTIDLGKTSLTLPLPQDYDTNTASLNIVQPLLSGGRDWVLFFGAFDTVRLNEALLKRAHDEVIYSVREAFYQTLSLDRLVEASAQAVKEMAEIESVASAHFQQGTVVKTDLLRAQMGLASARQNLIKTRNAAKLARMGLNFLLDEDLQTSWVLVEDESVVVPLKASLADSVELALRSRPEVRQMEAKLALDNKGIWLARADYFPSLRLFYTHKLDGALMVKDDKQRWDATSEKESWVAGGMFELLLFNGGLTNAAVREAKLNLSKTSRQRADVFKNIRLEVTAAYDKVNENLALLETMTKSLELAAENYRITRLQYTEGLVNSADALEAQTALLNAKTGAAAARYDYKLAQAALEKAVGLELQEGEFVDAE